MSAPCFAELGVFWVRSVTARSFRLVSLSAWRQTAVKCFTVSQIPKTLSCARLAQEADRVLRALFSQ